MTHTTEELQAMLADPSAVSRDIAKSILTELLAAREALRVAEEGLEAKIEQLSKAQAAAFARGDDHEGNIQWHRHCAFAEALTTIRSART